MCDSYYEFISTFEYLPLFISTASPIISPTKPPTHHTPSIPRLQTSTKPTPRNLVPYNKTLTPSSPSLPLRTLPAPSPPHPQKVPSPAPGRVISRGHGSGTEGVGDAEEKTGYLAWHLRGCRNGTGTGRVYPSAMIRYRKQSSNTSRTSAPHPSKPRCRQPRSGVNKAQTVPESQGQRIESEGRSIR